MSKQLTGIRENLHYHENSIEDNLNAYLPELAYELLLTEPTNVSPAQGMSPTTSEFLAVRFGSDAVSSRR
jgi:hypothetical protein